MMRPAARLLATSLLLGAVGAAAALGFGTSAAFAAAAADDDDGIGLSVTVTPAPAPSAAAGTRPNPISPTPGHADDVAPPTDAPLPDDDEVDVGGILFVSGLTSVYTWSMNPLDGAADTSFTVRNVSESTFNSTVRFWADGPIGNRLSEVADVKVTDLKPGESRTLEASLGGIGQSTFVQVHATLTPPKVVDGVEMDSITRDQSVVVPPWGVASLGGIGAVGFAGYSLLQFIRRPIIPALAGAPV